MEELITVAVDTQGLIYEIFMDIEKNYDKTLGVEKYLIIIWEHSGLSLDSASRIVRESGMTVTFSRAYLPEKEQIGFLQQLYFNSHTDYLAKRARVGCLNFDVGVVVDEHPVYGLRHTTRGYVEANTKIIELKKRLRIAASVADGVHISDSRDEARHNLLLVFSRTYSEIMASKGPFPFKLFSTDSIDKVLQLLNESVEYVIQRNFHELDDRTIAQHGDIDLLVKDSDAVARLLYAFPATNDGTRKLYRVGISGQDYLFDLRECSENYYDPLWSQSILTNRVLSPDGRFFMPAEVDRIYMTAYHALLHKFEASDDYLKQIKVMTTSVDGIGIGDWSSVKSSLKRFLSKNNYRITYPIDKTVKLNPWVYKALGLRSNSRRTRITLLPEHHARNFSQQILSNGVVLAKKEGSIHRSVVLAGAASPFNDFVLKCVQSSDLNFSPYLYNEHNYLELVGNEFAPIIFCHFMKDGWYHLLMERIHGVSLKHLVDSNSLTRAHLRVIETGLSALIDKLNAKCVRHRDLRLDNLFITSSGSLKVIDFGLAASLYDTGAPIPVALQGPSDDALAAGEIVNFLRTRCIGD